MSADRLDGADCVALTEFHDTRALKRSQQPSAFHGWLVCRASVYINHGGTVRPSSTEGNPHHCDVGAKLATRGEVGAFLSAIPVEERWKERCDGRAP